MATLHGNRGFRLALVALAAISLACGVAGGLLLIGVALPPHAAAGALSHGALMTGGFLGTVIGIERAVALKRGDAFLAPLSSGVAAILAIAGATAYSAWLFVFASAWFVGVNVRIVARQQAAHTRLLLVAAIAWLVGNLLVAAGAANAAAIPWWFAFLILTIAAERLELTRFLPRRSSSGPLLTVIVVALVAGAALVSAGYAYGNLAYGAALVCLAAWLLAFDVARRTIRKHGVAQFAAACLLGGYGWLAIAGLAWSLQGAGVAARDVALHALGLGFVLSMIFGHAPIILPAIARLNLRFGVYYYLPLALLHASLLVRFADEGTRKLGGQLNALAIGAFAICIAASAFSARSRDNTRPGRLGPVTHPHGQAPTDLPS
jgi:hypothetical protein